MLTDAYAHTGVPRSLNASDTLETLRKNKCEHGVLVLSPGHPDLFTLIEAHRLGGEQVRTIGVPHGRTEGERNACVYATLDAGAIGIRMQQDEPLNTTDGLNEIGRRGGWVYATDPLRSPTHTACLLDWLKRYPEGSIAAPHFLKTNTAELDQEGASDLLGHERFFPILSRHGGASKEGFPHADLLPWVERTVEACGWNRLLWGGELPVLYWRNEQLFQAQSWIQNLGIPMSAEDLEAFMHGNAQREIFGTPAPACKLSADDIPEWIRSFKPWPINLFGGALKVDAETYHRLLVAYQRELNRDSYVDDPAFTFSAYILKMAEKGVSID